MTWNHLLGQTPLHKKVCIFRSVRWSTTPTSYYYSRMMDTQTHHTLGRAFFEVLLLQECFMDTGSWVWDTGEKHLDHQDRDAFGLYVSLTSLDSFSFRRSVSSHLFSSPSAEACTQSCFSSFLGKLVFWFFLNFIWGNFWISPRYSFVGRVGVLCRKVLSNMRQTSTVGVKVSSRNRTVPRMRHK